MVLLGLGAGAFLVAQRPSFWIEFGSRLGKALLPLAWRYVSKRMPPEEEAVLQTAQKRAPRCQCVERKYRPYPGCQPYFFVNKNPSLLTYAVINSRLPCAGAGH